VVGGQGLVRTGGLNFLSARYYSLEIDRWFGGQTPLHRPGAFVGEYLACAGLQSVKGSVDDALRGDLDDVQPASQISLDEADVQPEDLASLLAQFVAQSIGQTPGGCECSLCTSLSTDRWSASPNGRRSRRHERQSRSRPSGSIRPFGEALLRQAVEAAVSQSRIDRWPAGCLNSV
jgi:hypothetical protein